jgi:predicted AlkP superfamily phosphohydrolase/phosphomutase
VEPGDEYSKLLAELKCRLESLCDREGTGDAVHAIRSVFITAEHYAGPCREDGPDLIIGYEAGYRCSWDCARGQIVAEIFSDNTRRWSGDHCVCPALVPGVLLANAELPCGSASIMDLAPTILDVFGIPADPSMQGRSLWLSDDSVSTHQGNRE